MTMYVEILSGVVRRDDHGVDEEGLLARLSRQPGGAAEAWPRRGVWSEEALVAEVTYDRALITFAARRGIDLSPRRFSHPQIQRERPEGELLEQGIDLDDAHPTLPADPEVSA